MPDRHPGWERDWRPTRRTKREKDLSNAFPKAHRLQRRRRDGHRGSDQRLHHRAAKFQQQPVDHQQRVRHRSQRPRIREWRIERPVWTGRRGSVRHGRQRVHADLHRIDSNGSNRDRQRGVHHHLPGGDELDLRRRHHDRRTSPRPWDDQRNDHHGHAGRRATRRQRRICGFLGRRGGPIPARGTVPIKAGSQIYSQGSGTIVSGTTADRATEAALGAYRRPRCPTERWRV